jgi:hypothetical protein
VERGTLEDITNPLSWLQMFQKKILPPFSRQQIEAFPPATQNIYFGKSKVII